MKKILFIVIILLAIYSGKSFAQDSKANLIKIWTIEEFIENGKKFADEEMLEIVVDFKEDGIYNYWEENEPDEGYWVYDETENKIYFDKGTADEMVWEVISLEPDKLVVKLKYDKSNYKYTFKPKVKVEN